MRISIPLLVGLTGVSLASPALAQFAPSPNPVTAPVTGQRILSSGTGEVTATGKISVTSGNGATVVMSGTSTLENAGTIEQTATGRAIDNTVNNSNLTVKNTGTISSVSSDAMRVNTANTSVSLTNSGTISVSNGGQAIDWAAITTGSSTLNNQTGGKISAAGEDAVRPGNNGVVNNAGTITATPTVTAGTASGSDGIDLRTEKTVTVNNSGTISGRSGIATDGANVGPSSLTVTNTAGTIQGVNGSGLNVDANTASPSAVNVTANVTNAAGATIKGGVLATTTVGDGDGIDIDGVLTLNNSGDVLGLGAKGGTNNAEGIAAGGGTIINNATGRIIGSSTLEDAPNGDATRAGNGILVDDSNTGNAVAATSITNSGLIEGKSGFAVKLIGTFDDVVTNNAGGTIRGAGAASGAALQTGDGADTLTNRGAIIGSNGAAIDLEGGDDLLTIAGGAASITGSISGGAGNNTLSFEIGAGKQFSYADAIANFSLVELKSGDVTVSGQNLYTGTTKLSGGKLTLDGTNRLASGSALDLNGGALAVLGTTSANGQGFSVLSLTDNSSIDLGLGTSLSVNSLGTVVTGKILTISNFNPSGGSDYAFRLFGDVTGNSGFQTLLGQTRINGVAAQYSFDGTYTEVSPMPEPATLALFGFGMAGLALVRRRCLKVT